MNIQTLNQPEASRLKPNFSDYYNEIDDAYDPLAHSTQSRVRPVPAKITAEVALCALQDVLRILPKITSPASLGYEHYRRAVQISERSKKGRGVLS